MSETVTAALSMFQRYLDEAIPPAAASYALATLMAQPPDVLMQRVATWTAEQNRTRSMLAGKLLLHALTKIYITGELQLLDREAVANYLDRVTGVALRLCPDAERDQLRGDLTAMRQSRTTSASLQASVEPARMPTLSTVAPANDGEAQAAKQYSLIFDRLTRQREAAGPKGPEADPQAFAQLLAMAATRSQTPEQLNQYLDQLRPLAGGGDKNVFVILGGAMPSWDVSNFIPGSARPPSQVDAMERIIDLAESPAVAMKRFREIVTAAVEKFNQGALGAALWMLDVAEDSISEKKLGLAVVDPFRAEAVEMISAVQLRKYAENKAKHVEQGFEMQRRKELEHDLHGRDVTFFSLRSLPAKRSTSKAWGCLAPGRLHRKGGCYEVRHSFYRSRGLRFQFYRVRGCRFSGVRRDRQEMAEPRRSGRLSGRAVD